LRGRLNGLTETKTATVMPKEVRPMNRALSASLLVAAILAQFPGPGSAQQTLFFTEPFDGAWTGWYDGTGGSIDTAVFSPSGGSSSARFHWNQGSTGEPGGARRRKLTASETVYVSFDLKLGTASAPWRGSQVTFHPHIIYLLTDANADYSGLAWDYLTFYIEWTLFTPRLAIQDGQRINLSQLTSSYPGLLGSTTTHAVAGGNGRQDQATPTGVDYYSIGAPNYANGTYWDAASPSLRNDTWHRVEVYVAMNSVSGGVPQANGIIRYWVDGALVVERTNVYLRTAQFATQRFNQFVLAPYIGTGSPSAQDMWIDNLVVADQPPASQAVPAPRNLGVIP
jgi:hypothetical protein